MPYKEPAAVLIGGTLEEHLRQLCMKNAIDITVVKKDGTLAPKKANQMNTDLAGAGIYNKLDQQSVTAWLALRNKAAHGDHDEYTPDQVALMFRRVTDFMATNPLK